MTAGTGSCDPGGAMQGGRPQNTSDSIEVKAVDFARLDGTKTCPHTT
jgi:hypothetical protein